jgi:hypothetical protein
MTLKKMPFTFAGLNYEIIDCARCSASRFLVVSSLRRGVDSEFLQQAAEPLDPVRDPVLAERMPVGGSVDGNHRLAQPQLRGGGKAYHAEIGSDLDNRIYIVSVEGNELWPQHLGRHLRDRGPARTGEIGVAYDLKAGVGEILSHFIVGDGVIGGEKRKALHSAIRFQRRGAGMRPDADSYSGFALDAALKLIGSGRAPIERDRRHSHHEIVRRAGHDAAHRIEHVATDHLRAGHEGIVADGLRVGRKNAAVMIGHADGPHHLEIRLHNGVGRRPEHTELAPPAQNVPHRRGSLSLTAQARP